MAYGKSNVGNLDIIGGDMAPKKGSIVTRKLLDPVEAGGRPQCDKGTSPYADMKPAKPRPARK